MVAQENQYLCYLLVAWPEKGTHSCPTYLTYFLYKNNNNNTNRTKLLYLLNIKIHQFSSVQFSRSVMSDSLQPHELQHARPPCPSLTPGVHSDSHPSSQWCQPAISSSVIPFSSCLQYSLSLCVLSSVQFSSVQFSHSVVSDSLWPHELQHARPPCPSLTPGVHSDSRPSSWWCHPAISSSVVPFSSCPQSLPASESFSMSQLFAWSGQSTGVSALASFLPKKSQGW